MKPTSPGLHAYLFSRRAWPWFAALALLLPPMFLLQPVPIDETRYLAVAWNMHVSGQWLVPWLDGAPYPDKAPMLFWLINLIWSVTGVHAWAARLLEGLIALATLPLLAAVEQRLGMDRPAREASMWLWLGCVAVAIYADVVMFDMLLTLCTLAAWQAIPALPERRWVSATLALALALGAGILVKGPVALLVGGVPALLAPWWLPSARARPLAFYLRLVAGLVIAAAVALAWALPAAHAGGTQYEDAIFLHQTFGRVAHSFAHARPWWWYLPVLPLMLLPWVVSLGRGASPAPPAGAKAERNRVANRFVLAAFVPGFVAFSLISGKQPHYLLPLLPALIMAAGMRVGANRWRVVGWRVGLTLGAIGVAVAAGLGWLEHPPSRVGATLCGGLVVLAGLFYLLRGRRSLAPSMAALGMLAALMLCKLAFVFSIGPRYDMRSVALRLATAQREGTPLLYAGTPYGLFTFAGRLTRPIPESTDPAAIMAWARTHPDGWVVSGDSGYRFAAAPFYRQPYLDHSLSIWHAGQLTSP